MSEHFECRNCFHVGPLTVHGRCERCHSDKVMSVEVMEVIEFRDLQLREQKTRAEREAAGMWLRNYRKAAS